MKYILSSLVVALCLAAAARAAVKPNPLFTPGAVLQRGVPVTVWGTANDGEKVTVKFAGQTVTTTAKNGAWQVRLRPMKASATPQTMTICGENTVEIPDVLVGEVWVCSGQSNMEFVLQNSVRATQDVAQATNPQIRLFQVPKLIAETPTNTVVGSWAPCIPTNAAKFTAVGYFFGRDLQKALGVPVGLISTSWGGTPAESWASKETLDANPLLKKLIEDWDKKIATYDPVKVAEQNKAAAAKYKEAAAKAKAEGKPAPRPPRPQGDPAKDPHRPTVLFNGMIAPLLPYAIKGAIWYQGESNAGHAKDYETLFPAMIKCWRKVWDNSSMPFLFVQIAPHQGMCPEIREAQLYTWQHVPHTAMAVITDYGNATDIHPRDKEPVGGRLALEARAIAYGENIEYSGPVFDSLRVRGNQAILGFTHVDGGLEAKDGALKGFTIAGADNNFVSAEAKIDGKRVIVTSPQVTKPVAVRYGWANVPDVNLFNKDGLPATPFRTDMK